MFAFVAGQGHDGGELRLVGKRYVRAKARAFATGPAALGTPGAVEDDDGARGCGRAGYGSDGGCTGEGAAAGENHVPTNTDRIATKPVSSGGRASGQARR